MEDEDRQEEDSRIKEEEEEEEDNQCYQDVTKSPEWRWRTRWRRSRLQQDGYATRWRMMEEDENYDGGPMMDEMK